MLQYTKTKKQKIALIVNYSEIVILFIFIKFDRETCTFSEIDISQPATVRAVVSYNRLEPQNWGSGDK
jgi:hypothetical protein